MNHSICGRAEHYETATDTGMIPVTCAYDDAYYINAFVETKLEVLRCNGNLQSQ